MKTNIEIQFNNHNIKVEQIQKLVKEDIKAKGVKMAMIDLLEIYYTPENTSAYYVATTKTGETIGSDEALTI